MGSQLLAESLGRDPRFEILAVASAADIFPIAAREPDVSLISMEFDAGASRYSPYLDLVDYGGP